MGDQKRYFGIRWNVFLSSGTTKFTRKIDQHDYEFIIVTCKENASFSINSLSNKTLLQNYNKCTLSRHDGTVLAECTVNHKPFGHYDIGNRTIPTETLCFKDSGCNYKVDFCFTTDNNTKVPSPDREYTVLMMQNLFMDQSSADITFQFNDLPDTMTAHKLILSQWPYFRTMFESEFAEGGPGQKEITVKEIKPGDFRHMIRYIYLGTLDVNATTLYSDNPTSTTLSWEGLYVTAHRYRVDDLCLIVLENIEKKLGQSLDVLDFLFRTARLYPELRTCVIKHVADKLRGQIAKKEVRDKYIHLPEYSEIIGELFQATSVFWK
ncbi:hypothetical protein BG000_011698 [Podila horticola]|nr:hypothetical protein BG000_011698 [Podila horticola]